MTVRNALLGILTLGPAYGLQLHYELGTRAPHRKATNVGQIYATLDRHMSAGLLVSAGESSEGLPLYQLSPAGAQLADEWLSGMNITSLPDWDDLLDHVLIALSVDSQRAQSVVDRLTQLALISGSEKPNSLSTAAQNRYAAAVTAWLGDVRNESGDAVHGYAQNRPKRGRPRQTKSQPSFESQSESLS